MAVPLRFQFSPTVVRGEINGASQVLPTGSGQMLYYEIQDGAQVGGAQTVVGVVAYDFINSRWAALFTNDGVLSTHQSTTYENDIGQVQAFIATLSSPPVPLTDEIGNDRPWPASIPPIGVA